mmetsp:Transcript_63817/g.142375  ORF Transcript_63817/g.142375 Transcript_63817/m.142375 type:complete len:207 (+) Transcript_63817:1274-1894(+)
MHNFCDGIFMGVAFRHCSNEMAWSIALATIFHEIAQELSDFLVLTSPLQGGLTPVAALLLNMLSGTSVLWGTIIIFSLDVEYTTIETRPPYNTTIHICTRMRTYGHAHLNSRAKSCRGTVTTWWACYLHSAVECMYRSAPLSACQKYTKACRICRSVPSVSALSAWEHSPSGWCCLITNTAVPKVQQAMPTEAGWASRIQEVVWMG